MHTKYNTQLKYERMVYRTRKMNSKNLKEKITYLATLARYFRKYNDVLEKKNKKIDLMKNNSRF